MFDWNYWPQRKRRPREGFRPLGDVLFSDRVECRHLIRQARSYIDRGFEDDLLDNKLNADGAIDDLEHAIQDLRTMQRLLGQKGKHPGFIGPSSADNAWYEAYADAVHSLGKRWPDQITEEQEEWCVQVADRYAPRPKAEL